MEKMLREIAVIKSYGYNINKTQRLIEGAYGVKYSALTFWQMYTGRIKA